LCWPPPLRTGAARNGGEAERHARLVGRAHRLRFAAPRVHARQANGGQRHRHRHILTKQVGRQIKAGHIVEHALAQGDLFQIGHVAFQRHLGIAAPVDIFEQERGQAAARQLAVIERGCGFHRAGPY
jgi:hypothetical protein